MKETGFTPHEYLQDVRLRHSKQLLAETELPVEEIAYQCGFSSATHFIRVFKKRTMITPAAFRQTLRKNVMYYNEEENGCVIIALSGIDFDIFLHHLSFPQIWRSKYRLLCANHHFQPSVFKVQFCVL